MKFLKWFRVAGLVLAGLVVVAMINSGDIAMGIVLLIVSAGIWWALSTRFDAARSVRVESGRSSQLDPSLPAGVRTTTGRVVLDACVPFEWADKPREVKLDTDTEARVRARWSEFGLPPL